MPMIQAEDGCGLYYERTGQGTPLVLIPGLGGDGRFWSGVVDLLKDRFDIVTVDQRGAGRSDRPEGRYTIDRIARDVITVLDAETIESAHLVGHSTGGTVVQTIALDAPLRARRLVISGSWARPDARFKALFSARLGLVEKGEAVIYQQLTHVFGFSPEWIDDHEEELEQAVARAGDTLSPLSVTASRIRMLLEFDRSGDLRRLAQPTLVIGAPDDLMIPFGNSQELARLIPSARLEQLSGGHFYPKTAPELFSLLVSRFLGEAKERS